MAVVWQNCQLNKLLQYISKSLNSSETKNTLKTRAGPWGGFCIVEKFTLSLSKGKIFIQVTNWLFSYQLFSHSFCASAAKAIPSISLHIIRLTFSISTVLYSSLHLKTFYRWVSYVLASEHHMSSEQERYVLFPVVATCLTDKL